MDGRRGITNKGWHQVPGTDFGDLSRDGPSEGDQIHFKVEEHWITVCRDAFGKADVNEGMVLMTREQWEQLVLRVNGLITGGGVVPAPRPASTGKRALEV